MSRALKYIKILTVFMLIPVWWQSCSDDKDEFKYDTLYAIYRVTGRVIANDDSGDAIADVAVSLEGDYVRLANTGRDRVETDENGNFSVEILTVPAAGYEFRLRLESSDQQYEPVTELPIFFDDPSYLNGNGEWFMGVAIWELGELFLNKAEIDDTPPIDLPEEGPESDQGSLTQPWD